MLYTNWCQEHLKDFEECIGYTFKTPMHAFSAIIHSSYSNESKELALTSNERQEFVGDAVLDLVASLMIYRDFPSFSEGKMSRLRARIVCEKALGESAAAIGLGKFLLLGKGEELNEGRTRLSILADALEAVVGGIFFDGGLVAAQFFLERVLKKAYQDAREDRRETDWKTTLQELLQKDGNICIEYKLVESHGPDHARTFKMKVAANGRLLGTGVGMSKKEAEQVAARNALDTLEGLEHETH